MAVAAAAGDEHGHEPADAVVGARVAAFGVPVDLQAGAPSSVEQAVEVMGVGISRIALGGERADEVGHDRGFDSEAAGDLLGREPAGAELADALVGVLVDHQRVDTGPVGQLGGFAPGLRASGRIAWLRRESCARAVCN